MAGCINTEPRRKFITKDKLNETQNLYFKTTMYYLFVYKSHFLVKSLTKDT